MFANPSPQSQGVLSRIVFGLAQAVQRKAATGDHACVSRDLWSPSGYGFKSSGTNFLL